MPATRKISPAFRAFLLPLILGLLSAPLLAAPAEQVIQITAQRFHYTPNEINLKKGVPVGYQKRKRTSAGLYWKR